MYKIKPIFIIGAPRSGTNMLRDALVQFDDVCTWPFDETNFMWKKGYKIYQNDELKIENLTEEKIKYIKKEFKKIATINASNTVVEKTCANTLRILYIDKIFPNAKYIFIHRDPIDTIASIKNKWKEGKNYKNFAKQIPWFNFLHLIKFIFYNIYLKIFAIQNVYSQWGPKIKNIDKIIQENSLCSIAAIQWKSCSEVAKQDLKELNNNKVFTLKYEDFVNNPKYYLRKILKFMDVSYENNSIYNSAVHISKINIGKGKNFLTSIELAEINKILS